MRLVRLVLGTLLVLVALPMVLAGTALWVAMQHRDADGRFSAGLDRVRTDGYAVVVPDVDALLRREAPFVRGGQTTLRVSGAGRLFLGLAPSADVDRYLAGVPGARLTRVRLARGPLPVELATVSGRGKPTEPPGDLRYWYAVGRPGSGGVTLSWSPSAVRGRHLALVVMNADATARVDARLTATVSPRWLNPTAWGLLILGTVLLVFAVAALLWPGRRRDIVYVVEPSQVPEISARLGVRPPLPVPATTVARAPVPVPAAAPGRPGTVAPVPVPADLPPSVRPNLAWPPAAAERGTAPVSEVPEEPAAEDRAPDDSEPSQPEPAEALAAR